MTISKIPGSISADPESGAVAQQKNIRPEKCGLRPRFFAESPAVDGMEIPTEV